LSLHLTGTPLAPQLAASARGEGITSGKVRGLSFQTQLAVDEGVKLSFGAQSNGDPIGKLEATAALSGAELVELARAKVDPASLDLLHLGINPPGGGGFLGHANLIAELGARTLLRKGAASVLDGELSGQVDARHLDLAFLSGVAPRLRGTGGTLDAQVKVSGLLGKPKPEGNARLR